jgi:hypothetical protein
MSKMSENVSLLMSAGQALSLELCAHASRGSVPIATSALSDHPSPSVSVTARAGVGRPWSPVALIVIKATTIPRTRTAPT